MNATFIQQVDVLFKKLRLAEIGITREEVLFNSSANLRAQADHSAGKEGKRVLQFFNTESLEKALQYYAKDYIVFGMQLPRWVEEIPTPLELGNVHP